jgi:glycosyltransferase involved in cell wall biosynthesis
MQLSEKNKICFVLPWFGENIPGGAEMESRNWILNLSKFFEIEVLSTCVKDFFSDWNQNFWKNGVYKEMGVVVRRFSADKINRDEFHQVNRLLMNGKNPSHFEENVFKNGIIKSTALNEFIKSNKAGYKYFIFMPYMFGTTIEIILEVKEKAILIPCLHDESYARMKIFNEIFNNVFRVFFHLQSEKKLAENLYGRNENFRVVGEGLETNISGNIDRFFKKYGISDFYVFVGRKDEGKNFSLMINWFKNFKKLSKSRKKLVLIGPGEKFHFPNDGIFDLGFISKEDKFDAISASDLLINLSLNESFSLVLMEAGLLEKPVIVHSLCDATKEHCLRGNMGLFVKDFFEFYEGLVFLEKNPKISNVLGKLGRNYVLENFSFEKVIDNFLVNLQ